VEQVRRNIWCLRRSIPAFFPACLSTPKRKLFVLIGVPRAEGKILQALCSDGFEAASFWLDQLLHTQEVTGSVPGWEWPESTCLGCKRSRVQISADRPVFSISYVAFPRLAETAVDDSADVESLKDQQPRYLGGPPLLWAQGVVGSNPAAPTNRGPGSSQVLSGQFCSCGQPHDSTSKVPRRSAAALRWTESKQQGGYDALRDQRQDRCLA